MEDNQESIDVKVKIRKMKRQKDLKIIYKETMKDLHEIQVSKEDIVNTLGYFSNKRNEIKYQNVIYIEESVPYEIFHEFISSIETSEISINDRNFESYLYLSNKYEYYDLRQEIREFIENRPDIEITLKKLIESQKKDTNKSSNEQNDQNELDKEEIIAKNLDLSIKTGLLNQLSIEKLIRIFKSPKRQIKDNHLLFSFIISVLKNKKEELKNKIENKNQNDNENDDSKYDQYFTILPSFLDFCSMTKSEITELIETIGDGELISSQNSIKRMKMLIDEKEENQDKYSKLEQRVEKLERMINIQEERENELKQKISDIQDHLSRVEQENEKMKNEIKLHEEREKIATKSIDELKDQLLKIQENEKESNSQIQEEHKQDLEISCKKTKELNEIDCNDGIFGYLFKMNNDSNPAENGIIEISGNSYNQSYKKDLPNIIDSKWTGDYWASEGVSDSFIMIDFKDSCVKINKYKLGLGTRSGQFYFKSWILTGITKEGKEIVLDDVNNLPGVTKDHHEIMKDTNNHEYVRSVKLTMKGKCSEGRNYMEIYYIELFGSIINKC